MSRSAAKAEVADTLTALRVALDPHMQRLKNLFAEWDANGDNKVSAQEFHKAMKVLALDAPKATIDALFSAIDKDRSGFIEYKELDKTLSAIEMPATKPEGVEAEVQTTLTAELMREDIERLTQRAEAAEAEISRAWAAAEAAERSAESRARRAAEEVIECKLAAGRSVEEAEAACAREAARGNQLAAELERAMSSLSDVERQASHLEQVALQAHHVATQARQAEAMAERRAMEAAQRAGEAERREGLARAAEEEATRRAEEAERQAAEAQRREELRGKEAEERLAAAELNFATELEMARVCASATRTHARTPS
jgi:hypothetical protein